MADPRHNAAHAEPTIAAAGTREGGVLRTEVDFDLLVCELEGRPSKQLGDSGRRCGGSTG